MPIAGASGLFQLLPQYFPRLISTLSEILQPPPSISGVFGKDSLGPGLPWRRLATGPAAYDSGAGNLADRLKANKSFDSLPTETQNS